jgi:hypothetical protein
MSQPLAQPERIGRLQARSPQNPPHRVRATTAGISEHRQGRRSLLQLGGQGFALASVEADPAGVLPGATDPGEGELQGGGGRVEAQPLRRQMLEEQPTDAEPEGVAAGKDHHTAIRRQGVPQELDELGRVVGFPQLGQGGRSQEPSAGLLQEAAGHRHQISGDKQPLPSRGKARHPGGIGTHHIHPSLLLQWLPCLCWP